MITTINETNRTENMWDSIYTVFRICYDIEPECIILNLNEFVSEQTEIKYGILDLECQAKLVHYIDKDCSYITLSKIIDNETEQELDFNPLDNMLRIKGSELPDTTDVQKYIEFLSEKALEFFATNDLQKVGK